MGRRARSGIYEACPERSRRAGARFYSADLGRFLQADSIIPSAGDPQSLNRYSYVVNNPLRYTDPSGNCHTPDCLAAKARLTGPQSPACYSCGVRQPPSPPSAGPSPPPSAPPSSNAATPAQVYDYLRERGVTMEQAKCTAWGTPLHCAIAQYGWCGVYPQMAMCLDYSTFPRPVCTIDNPQACPTTDMSDGPFDPESLTRAVRQVATTVAEALTSDCAQAVGLGVAFFAMHVPVVRAATGAATAGNVAIRVGMSVAAGTEVISSSPVEAADIYISVAGLTIDKVEACVD